LFSTEVVGERKGKIGAQIAENLPARIHSWSFGFAGAVGSFLLAVGACTCDYSSRDRLGKTAFSERK